MSERPKLLIFVTEDWYFCSHRLSLGKAAVETGYQVVLVTRIRDHRKVIEGIGIRIVELEQQRGGLNPVQELRILLRLWNIYRQEKPDLLHHVAIKPVVYGSLIACLLGLSNRVNALAGLGWLYSSSKLLPKFIGFILVQFLRLFLKSGAVIVQNPDDLQWLSQIGVPSANIHLIRGSGVDLQGFQPIHREAPSIPIVMLVARMLKDKGVRELVEASRLLRDRGLGVRVVLVGNPDLSNRASLSEEELILWQEQKLVEWWGHQKNVFKCYAQADIACLPSYREGLPKSLLEAAACGLPIVTSDTPGCREVIRHQENGLLVPIKDSLALADALEILLKDPELRHRMGQRSRKMAEQEFSEDRVVEQTLAVYRELMS